MVLWDRYPTYLQVQLFWPLYYQPKQCTINGEIPQIYQMPPNNGNFMIPAHPFTSNGQVDTFHLQGLPEINQTHVPKPCVLRCLWTWWYCHVSILDVQVVPIMALNQPPPKKELTVFFWGGIICFILILEIVAPPPKKQQLRTTKPYIQHNPTGNTCSNL